MRIRFIVVGTKMPAWVQEGYQQYARRLPRELILELIEIPLAHRGKNADLHRLITKEGEAMMARDLGLDEERATPMVELQEEET